ncbi:hypothetical protein HYU23_03565 [Candidatus Woesearchaeota archaeon]|nr:hypothetical protein [Candidatus Woesearchaeota archaeon]
MPDEKEYEDIKAGVEGVIPEAPSPSETDIPITETVAAEDSTLPETNYSQPKYAGYGETPAYNTGNQLDMERIHEIIEAIIGEKWQEVMSNVGNIAVWKEKTNNDIISIKQELIRLQERFEQLQNAVLGRVKEYDEGIKGLVVLDVLMLILLHFLLFFQEHR